MEVEQWSAFLPHSWEVKPLRAVADFWVSNVDKLSRKDEQQVRLCNYTDVYKHQFITLDLDFMRATATLAEIKKFRLQTSDVVITKDSESWDDIGVPALVIETAEDLVCGYHLAILRSRDGEIDGRFLFRCLQAKPIRVWLELAANGVTRFGIPKEEIGLMPLPVPPLDQQIRLASFLDRETSRIDALIAAKERLFELLAEKRRALITQAVTKGLNPNAPMRDSGLPWLEEIPRHWEMKKLKYLSTGGLVNGLFKKKDQYGSGTKLINVFDIYREDFVVDSAGLESVELVDGEIGKYRVLEGDVFFVRSSLKLEGIAASAVVTNAKEEMVFECHLIRARPDQKNIVPEFLINYLNSEPIRAK